MYRTFDPVATEYTRRIAEEAKAKEAERRAQKAAEEEERRREVAGLSGLRSTKCHIVVEPLEQVHLPVKAEQKVYELEAPGSPTSPASVSLESYHTATPSTDEIDSETHQSHANDDTARGLRADLGRERSRIEKLEQEIRQAKHEIASLSSQREADQRQYIQAVRAQDYEHAAELQTHLEALHHQLETAWADRRKLENNLEEGRSREEVLRRQLRDARDEAQQLEEQRGTERKLKSSRDVKGSMSNKGKERKAVRKISSKQDRQAIRVEYAEYEIHPKVAETARCAVM